MTREAIELAIKACKETWNEKTCKKIRDALEQEPSSDAISLETVIQWLMAKDIILSSQEEIVRKELKQLLFVKQEPKTGRWMRKTKVDGVYDIAGVKTWGIKCQCNRCDFTTTVIEDFGYYNYCPHCGARMISEKIHCTCTDAEIAKSFIEDVETVKDLLPKTESENNCNTCLHYKPDNPYCECCFDLDKYEKEDIRNE